MSGAIFTLIHLLLDIIKANEKKILLLFFFCNTIMQQNKNMKSWDCNNEALVCMSSSKKRM
jgi:hypothetical protein